MQIRLESSWLTLLEDQFEQPYFKKIKEFLLNEKKSATVYPPSARIFAALDFCPISETKVIIIGQDPYHNPGQAHGLSFSVPFGVTQPPSLRTVFTEMQNDTGIMPPAHGCLE